MPSVTLDREWRPSEPACPGTTILLVDSDRSLSEGLSRGLAQQGYYVLMAGTAAEAVRMVQINAPQLIVIDHRLPDMEGTALLEQFAANAATCHIPAIVLSAMARPDIIRRSRVSGCQYFVRKPFDLKALFYLIQHALDETSRALALAAR